LATVDVLGLRYNIVGLGRRKEDRHSYQVGRGGKAARKNTVLDFGLLLYGRFAFEFGKQFIDMDTVIAINNTPCDGVHVDAMPDQV
jgi:hypothetical protein